MFMKRIVPFSLPLLYASIYSHLLSVFMFWLRICEEIFPNNQWLNIYHVTNLKEKLCIYMIVWIIKFRKSKCIFMCYSSIMRLCLLYILIVSHVTYIKLPKLEYDQMININEILGLSSNVSGLFRFIFFFNFKTVGKESYSHCPWHFKC